MPGFSIIEIGAGKVEQPLTVHIENHIPFFHSEILPIRPLFHEIDYGMPLSALESPETGAGTSFLPAPILLQGDVCDRGQFDTVSGRMEPQIERLQKVHACHDHLALSRNTPRAQQFAVLDP